jgi:hypothetical protein
MCGSENDAGGLEVGAEDIVERKIRGKSAAENEEAAKI